MGERLDQWRDDRTETCVRGWLMGDLMGGCSHWAGDGKCGSGRRMGGWAGPEVGGQDGPLTADLTPHSLDS